MYSVCATYKKETKKRNVKKREREKEMKNDRERDRQRANDRERDREMVDRNRGAHMAQSTHHDAKRASVCDPCAERCLGIRMAGNTTTERKNDLKVRNIVVKLSLN